MSDQLSNSLDSRLRTAIDKSVSNPVMFFFTSGAAWLAVAVFLGIIASVKAHWPSFMEDFGALSTGRAYVAHLNVLIYGWCFQAAFGAIIWLMARLCRKPSTQPGTILVAGHLWNVGVTIGLLGILLGGGTGVPFMEFPVASHAIFFICYVLISIWSFVQFRVREGGHVYVSQWYILAALFLFPWIYGTANMFIFAFDGHPVMTAGIAAWFKSAIMLLFFIPVAIASAYYIAPKVTGRPVYSYNLALFGFWALIAVGGWAGMQKLTGAPIPPQLTYIGAGAAIFFFIPAVTVGLNILMTIGSHGELAKQSPSLRFISAGIIALVAMGALGIFLNLPSVQQGVQFSISGYGYEMLGLYGVFTMCMFGAIYFIVPRITMREWLSTRFIKMHFNLSTYGIIAVVLGSILGGYLQGDAQQAWDQPWSNAATSTFFVHIFNTFAWIFVLISNLFFCFHLLLMWARLGRRSNHPTLLTEKHGGTPHGPEGKIQTT